MPGVSVTELLRDLDAARLEYEAARTECGPNEVTDRLRAAARALQRAERALKLKGHGVRADEGAVRPT
jgi:hypothetical protein